MPRWTDCENGCPFQATLLRGQPDKRGNRRSFRRGGRRETRQAKVKRDQDITTRYFRDYEALENAFRRRIATLLPRKHAGTALFWRDFQRLFDALPELTASRTEHYITSNPRDCLAFGTPRQVLQAVLMTTATSTQEVSADLAGIAARFGLQSHLNQPVRSLSGGETVRLALAKAFTAAARADRLTLASPFSWLSQTNRRYFYTLADHCRTLGKPLEVFALEGEDDTATPDFRTGLPPGPDFQLVFRRARVILNTVFDRLHNRRLQAAITDGAYDLRSPCLIQGDNGQGKSLVAKLLARAMPREGQADLETAGRKGRVRLLLQDLINQAMMRSFRQIASGAIPGGLTRVGRLYDAIRAEMTTAGEATMPDAVCSFEDAFRVRTPATLVELKILLAAVRLADEPAAIVMDEPDWGLRRFTALAYVRGVIRAAHRKGIPVLLISHKPWWQPWAGSGLAVSKVRPRQPAGSAEPFQIRIERTAFAQ